MTTSRCSPPGLPVAHSCPYTLIGQSSVPLPPHVAGLHRIPLHSVGAGTSGLSRPGSRRVALGCLWLGSRRTWPPALSIQ